MSDPLITAAQTGSSAPPGAPRLLLAAAVVIVGALLPIQAGMNSIIREQSGHPLYAGVMNFTVGLGIVLTVLLLLRPGAPNLAALQAAPWWAFLGGLIGASMVIVAAIAAPKLGAAFMVACLIAGQLTASVIIDHLGLARYPTRPISWDRILGVILLIAGLLLIERSTRTPGLPPANLP